MCQLLCSSGSQIFFGEGQNAAVWLGNREFLVARAVPGIPGPSAEKEIVLLCAVRLSVSQGDISSPESKVNCPSVRNCFLSLLDYSSCKPVEEPQVQEKQQRIKNQVVKPCFLHLFSLTYIIIKYHKKLFLQQSRGAIPVTVMFSVTNIQFYWAITSTTSHAGCGFCME